MILLPLRILLGGGLLSFCHSLWRVVCLMSRLTLHVAGVGVVVGKAAIHVGEQLDDFAADGAQDAGGRCAGNAVAAVHHDFQGARHGLLDLAQPGACALA